MSDLNFEKIREDFPILFQKVNNQKLVYLDNAATTHRPKQVLDAMRNYDEMFNANPHRGVHYLGMKATEMFEDVREKVAKFINAKESRSIVYTRNTTESLNLIAYSYGLNFINEGDEIVISIAEHHSNLLPWQMVARNKGAILKYMYLDNEGRLPLEEVKNKITSKTKLVSITHMSNVLGVINPIKEIVKFAHEMGAVVVVDGAQSVPHIKVDVQELDCDFLVFSAHKMSGPMGIGILYGKPELLEKMPPFLTGGSMIEFVEEQSATFAPIPNKFEAGTPDVEGVVGLGSAIDYLNNIGMDRIKEHEEELTAYALEKMNALNFIKIHGPLNIKDRGGVISFSVEDVHPHDVATILDSYGVAVRAGHHCAQPLMAFLGVPATSRASFYFYTTKEEIDIFIDSLKKVRKWLGYE